MSTQTPSSSTPEVSKKRKRDNSSSSRWKHEVFLSFYGKDTRTSFTDHLYADLKRKGILVFRDDEALQRGEDISKALRKAIQKSQYVIVILSENYASSKWCLRELAEIVEWEKKTKLITIIPIFYYVNPSDVRNQRGTFAKAFAAHEKDPKLDIKEIKMWKKAFSKVGNIKGEHIHDRYESTIIQDISRRISRKLNSRFSSHDYDKLVAIDCPVDKMMKLLDMESDDVLFIGIHGMGGVGKTTLAEIIYDRVSNSNSQFEGSSFISCIREKSVSARDLASLQKELLSTIMEEEIHVWDQNQGYRMRKKMLSNKRVFIVLDDVASDEQLTALAGDRKWFGPGSRVIITSRDSHLLKRHGVNVIYKVEQLQEDEALQLFSLSAFDKTHPPKNYKDLSMDFVNYAQGLPLALNVLGSFLYEREIDAWKSVRDKLKAIPNPKIMDVLQISFDGLEESQKELFLDIAFVFRGHEHISSGMLLESFGHYRIDIDILLEKSIISKSKYGWLSMHDLLKELGREIVRRECRRDHPGGRSRLFCVEDLYHVLETDTGTDATKAIVVHSCAETEDQKVLKAKAFSKMRKLRYLKFPDSRTIQWSGDPLKYMPTNELRFLEWPGYHLKTLPSSFQQKHLTVLRLYDSRIKQLWKGSMVLPNLKVFDPSNSKNLIETPDLTGIPNLESLNLDGCRSLCEVHPSIGSLKKLKWLTLDKCSSLEKLPDLSSLECLTYLEASETTMTQIPSVNLRPKSNIDDFGVRFYFSGSKLMRLESRDPIYDIGSLVEYQREGTYDYIEAKCIDFDSKVENILDMAGVVISALDDDLNMISGWSLGFHMIPDWVQYKSNGSFVKIDLDANTNPEMGR
ncbi:TMV resistance protein N-like isoform X2 [Juglans regia]|uniref:TMV resistance protein N-like isoform X2 n=2 Tax=Juglans regia TaxID=51240 RepID=A0A2I4F0Y4_JUGRE|nr:TMV resistance protein N-like isoform X2 [Juglans regia]